MGVCLSVHQLTEGIKKYVHVHVAFVCGWDQDRSVSERCLGTHAAGFH